MIFKFQPFSTSKNLGEEYNAHCAMVPSADDWILIMDYDSMILTPESYSVIENAIKNYPDTLIFGARCNRIGLSYQRLEDKPDENDSIRYHIKIAQALANKYPNGENSTAKYVAGFFLLFRKSYWLENKFQDQIMNHTGNLFDWVFCKTASKIEGAVRVLKGVYVWHTYRILKDYKDKSHLKA